MEDDKDWKTAVELETERWGSNGDTGEIEEYNQCHLITSYNQSFTNRKRLLRVLLIMLKFVTTLNGYHGLHYLDEDISTYKVWVCLSVQKTKRQYIPESKSGFLISRVMPLMSFTNISSHSSLKKYFLCTL